jgi:hypothetical protein
LVQEHVGTDHLPVTYQKALHMCRAPYVGFLDGDDYWPKDKLESLLPAFDDPEIVVSYGLTEVVAEEVVKHTPTTPGPEFYRLFPRECLFNTPPGMAARAMLDPRALTFSHPVGALIRREALGRIGGLRSYPGLPNMDYPTFLYLTLEGRFHFVERVMGFWRMHAGQTTQVRRAEILSGVYRQACDFQREYGSRIELSEQEWQEINRRWEVTLRRLHTQTGRRLLAERKWAEARRHFHDALGVAPLRRRPIPFLGILASWLGVDIERLYRLRGKPWYRRGAGGGTERVP